MIPSSFMTFINSSFNLLSSSLYLHSCAFILGWCIYSSQFLFCFHVKLQYHNYNIVSLCCGLNLSISTQTVLCLFYIFPFPYHLESVQVWVPPRLPISVLMGLSCFLVYYSYWSWKCSLPLFWSCTVPGIYPWLSNQKLVVLALGPCSRHCTYCFALFTGLTALWLPILLLISSPVS